jgi:polysaccharide pyruvyl transferase WcaK-like protein
VSEKLSGLPDKMSQTILVYGWYHQGNLGDDLFISAFKHLFPNYNLVFTSIITNQDLQNIDVVFIGGGSFLAEAINIVDSSVLEELKKKKIFYISVGTETNLHPHHQELMSVAKLIATRTAINIENIKKINSNVLIIPDLVYSLPATISANKIKKSVLVIPNILVTPSWHDTYWKHAAWLYFKSEFSQFLDDLVNSNYTINFLPMCINDQWNDSHAAIEIINSMTHRSNDYLLDKKIDIKSVTKLISEYDLVITQRYHGAVLAEMANVPCITLCHHDKLKNSSGLQLSYFGFSKNKISEQFYFALKYSNTNLPIDRDIFDSLTQTVIALI